MYDKEQLNELLSNIECFDPNIMREINECIIDVDRYIKSENNPTLLLQLNTTLQVLSGVMDTLNGNAIYKK